MIPYLAFLKPPWRDWYYEAQFVIDRAHFLLFVLLTVQVYFSILTLKTEIYIVSTRK